jgi:2-polyprenyl-3-methyl-5-hydroxy-6-metoxy-1,4-benzoquinol methylase
MVALATAMLGLDAMKEQDNGQSRRIINKTPRSIVGFFEDRLCGLHDLLRYVEGATVLDIGMNNGLVGFQFARYGAALVHGCDFHEPSVNAARAIFSELALPSRFEVVDLVQGSSALEAAFGQDYLLRYDVVLFLGIYNKLKFQASDALITELVRHLVSRTARFFVVRSVPQFLDDLRPLFIDTGLCRVHFSDLSPIVGPVEIWQRS